MFTNVVKPSVSGPSSDLARMDRPLLYEVTGEGDPIILVPGTLTGWVSWAAHAERLADTRKVVRVQLRNVEFAEEEIGRAHV